MALSSHQRRSLGGLLAYEDLFPPYYCLFLLTKISIDDMQPEGIVRSVKDDGRDDVSDGMGWPVGVSGKGERGSWTDLMEELIR